MPSTPTPPPTAPPPTAPPPAPPSTLRADAARNRASLLAVATQAFAAAETEPSMRAIARAAGVGIGTLYRHFPTREDLVDAVYRDQVHRLTVGAQELLAEHSPPVALRGWMGLFANWIATKQGMLDTLLAMIEAGEISNDHTRVELTAAVSSILDAGRASGELRADVEVDDVLAGIVGVVSVAGRTHQQDRARRLLDLLVDGLTATTGTAGNA